MTISDKNQVAESDRIVVKHNYDSQHTVAYAGKLVTIYRNWLVVQATWVHGYYDLGCLTFQNGDILTEFFSKRRPYNAFRVDRNTGEHAGWYCNITAPLEVIGNEIHWHDLYLDVVLQPDGAIHLLDEDELQRSGIADSDPQLYRYILNARDGLLDLVKRRAYPFSTTDIAQQ